MGLPLLLRFKSLLVGTPAEAVANRLRRCVMGFRRYRYPELWELYLEASRLPLILGKLLKKESCCIDVGGHIGSFLSLLKRFAPLGQHVVFEPSVVKSGWLRRQFPNVSVFPIAVSDNTGEGVFAEDLIRPGYSALETWDSPTHAVRYAVPTSRLDDVHLEMPRIDLIKIDIEGGELAALRGATGLIAAWQPAIIFECGSQYVAASAGINRKQLYDFLVRTLGYQIFCFGDYLFNKGPMSFDEFQKCGLYPFRAFNFLALHCRRESDEEMIGRDPP